MNENEAIELSKKKGKSIYIRSTPQWRHSQAAYWLVAGTSCTKPNTCTDSQKDRS